MSDRGKVEKQIINYSVKRGNKYNQMENERTALMENESRISNSSKCGNREKFSPHTNRLQQTVVENFIKLKTITNHSPRKFRS